MRQFIRLTDRTRNSGIELLRIVAILMIVASHSLPFYGNPSSFTYVNLNQPTANFTNFVMIFIKHFGQMGNCIFMVISAYFLIDDNAVKTKKIATLVMDSFVFSVAILFLALAFNIRMSGKEFVEQLFPITYQGCWFVGCYLFLYLVHPVLNHIVYESSQKQLLRIALVMFLLYSVLSTIIGGQGYYYSFLVAYIMIYIVTAYTKLYLRTASANLKINCVAVIIGVLGILSLLIVTNIIGLSVDSISNNMLKWNIFSNPFMILFAIGMFNIFLRVQFKSSIINSMAKLTLYVYMIHENPIVRDNFKPFFFQKSPFETSLTSVSILILLTLVICFPVSWIYKKYVQKILWRIWLKVLKTPRNLYTKMETKLLEIK